MLLSDTIKQFGFRTGILLLVKLIGACVRIPLFNWLGAEGVGLYQIIYSIYGLLLTAVTGGFPTSLALMAAGSRSQALKFLKLSIITLCLISILASAMLHMNSYRIAALFGDPFMEIPIRYISPLILIVPFLSLLRGYLQGIEKYEAVAISELIEQLVRVIMILLLVSVLAREGIYRAVSGALLGAFLGATAAVAYLTFLLLRYLYKEVEETANKTLPANRVLDFFETSSAIFAARLVIPVAEFLDALIIPQRLQISGLSLTEATAAYGSFSGMGAVIVYIPCLFTSSLSHIMSSKLSSDWYLQRTERFWEQSKKILRMGWIWGLGTSFILIYFHRELSSVLFHDTTASAAIAYMGAVPLLSGMRDLTSTILWAKGKKSQPMIGLMLGFTGSLCGGYFLIALPEYRFLGTAAELIGFELIALLWNGINLKKEIKFYVKPLFIESALFLGSMLISCKLLNVLLEFLGLPAGLGSILNLAVASGIFICLFAMSTYASRLKKEI